LDHFIPEPVGTESNLLVAASDEIMFSKSMMEFWDSPRQDLIVDRLSECEKVGSCVISCVCELVTKKEWKENL